MRTVCRTAIGWLLPFLCFAAPPVESWVPARWPWSDAKSLELLEDSPINCLLLKAYDTAFLAAAKRRGLITLAVISAGTDVLTEVKKAMLLGVTGIVLDGRFPNATRNAVELAAGITPLIQLMPRDQLELETGATVVATYEGVWPGIAVEENGTMKAGPTGNPWINTNTGWIRSIRAASDASVWIANRPPVRTIIPVARYIQAVADAAMSGGRWVLAFDDDLAGRLAGRQSTAMRDWKRIMQAVRYFEEHAETRQMRGYGNVILIPNMRKGGLISGALLEMLVAKAIPVRLVPPQFLDVRTTQGAGLVLDFSGSLDSHQEALLQTFSNSGGKLLRESPVLEDRDLPIEAMTGDQTVFNRLNGLWSRISSMLRPASYGVRLFNASSVLSNVLVSDDGRTLSIELVNYSDYPIEDLSIRFPSDYKRATLITPEEAPRSLATTVAEHEFTVTVDKMSVCAAVELTR